MNIYLTPWQTMNRLLLITLILTGITACTLSRQEAEPLHKSAVIYPDYAETMLPVNLCTYVCAQG